MSIQLGALQNNSPQGQRIHPANSATPADTRLAAIHLRRSTFSCKKIFAATALKMAAGATRLSWTPSPSRWSQFSKSRAAQTTYLLNPRFDHGHEFRRVAFLPPTLGMAQLHQAVAVLVCSIRYAALGSSNFSSPACSSTTAPSGSTAIGRSIIRKI